MTLVRHYNDVVMGAIASQITSLTIVYSCLNSGADQRRHQSYASLAWSYIWLEIVLFSIIIAIVRACACWALFVVTLTNTVHLDIHIYIYICWNRAHMGRIKRKMMDSNLCWKMAFIPSQEKNPATRYIQYKIRIQRVNTFQNPYISLPD